MANISLRAYLQKIESWIEENNIDRAVSQSAYLLQKYPKNLSVFQVLSKALLQKQDFINADKAFDIILQIEPDDFVSHIGKSIIAESNHSLNLAIEHMKYALETQPANEGLQNELKRLLLANDGVEPNKILLTRGALIKMYLKGKLYQQAISEARIGISENPQRIDYKIAMAKSFFESGNLIQAVETCVEIISELPYCLPANLILDQVITKNHTTNNFGFYHNRLIELDPYHAFMLPSTKSVFDVPDIAVLVEDLSGNDSLEIEIEPNLNIVDFNKSTIETNTKFPEADTDWDSILKNALESEESRKGIKNNHQTSETLNSRKKNFLDKLRSSKPLTDNQKDIPDWFFDENGDLKSNEIETDQFTSGESHEDVVPGADEILSSNFNESGNFDVDIVPAIDEFRDLEKTNTLWKNDEETTSQVNDTNHKIKLDDTQQIIISNNNPIDLLTGSAKALEGGNIEFACATLRKLVTDNINLHEVANQLERAIELYPEQHEFRLLLSETFLAMGEKEKSLTILQNAQKNILL